MDFCLTDIEILEGSMVGKALFIIVIIIKLFDRKNVLKEGREGSCCQLVKNYLIG